MTVLVIMIMEEKMRRMFNHGDETFQRMSKAGNLAAESSDYITLYVKVSITTEDIGGLCHIFINLEIESSNHGQQRFIDRMIFCSSPADYASQMGRSVYLNKPSTR